MTQIHILIFTEYGWDEGDESTTMVIGAFSSKKLAEEAEIKLYKERGSISSSKFHKEIDGVYYDLHGSTEIKSIEVDKFDKFGHL